jgi:hypothetical protein
MTYISQQFKVSEVILVLKTLTSQDSIPILSSTLPGVFM